MIHLRQLPNGMRIFENVVVKYMDRREEYNGEHGLLHMIRTANLALEIAQRLANPMDYMDHEVIFFGGLLHDIGRLNDGPDEQHGFRGVKPAVECLNELAVLELFSGERLAIGLICGIVIEHCEPGPGSFDHACVVKDADKVERIRLGEGQLDIDRLAFGVSRNMIPEAGDFIEKYKVWANVFQCDPRPTTEQESEEPKE